MSPRYVAVARSLGAVHGSIGSSITSFFDAVGSFFDSLSRVGWVSLLLGAIALRHLPDAALAGVLHTLRAAYPDEPIPFRRIWGAYIAAYGFNNVIPARGGDVIKLFLVKQSIPHATYPAVGAAICVEAVFDAVMAIFILTLRLQPGRLPQAAGLREARRVRPVVLRQRIRSSRCFSLTRAGDRACSSASRCCRSA